MYGNLWRGEGGIKRGKISYHISFIKIIKQRIEKSSWGHCIFRLRSIIFYFEQNLCWYFFLTFLFIWVTWSFYDMLISTTLHIDLYIILSLYFLQMVIQECKLNASLVSLGCVPISIDYPHNETLCKLCDGKVCNGKFCIADRKLFRVSIIFFSNINLLILII